MTTLKIKIFELEKDVDVYIIDEKNFKYEFLIGLDIIKSFKLIQNEDLSITQKHCVNTENEKTEFFFTNIRTNTVLQEIQKNNSIWSNYKINLNEHVNKQDFKLMIEHLNQYQKNKIDRLISKYKSVFAKDKYDVGSVDGYEARIDLLVDKYCSKRPYRCTIEDKKEIEKQIAKLLDTKLIEESYSPFAAPVTLAFKKEENRKSRLCIDFRDLNKIVVPQAQPFPLIEDLMMKTRMQIFFNIRHKFSILVYPFTNRRSKKDGIRYTGWTFSMDMPSIWVKDLTSNFSENIK